MRSAWDTPADAEEFFTAYTLKLAGDERAQQITLRIRAGILASPEPRSVREPARPKMPWSSLRPTGPLSIGRCMGSPAIEMDTGDNTAS